MSTMLFDVKCVNHFIERFLVMVVVKVCFSDHSSQEVFKQSRLYHRCLQSNFSIW